MGGKKNAEVEPEEHVRETSLTCLLSKKKNRNTKMTAAATIKYIRSMASRYQGLSEGCAADPNGIVYGPIHRRSRKLCRNLSKLL